MASFAIFRCDASADIGTGHVVRCVTLGEALKRRGWNYCLLSLPGTKAAVKSFISPASQIIETEAADDPTTLRALFPSGCNLLVVDSYRLGLEFERNVADCAEQRMVIDDLPTRSHDTDVLLDQTLGRSAHAYGDLVSPKTQMLLGPAYALLRPEFAAARLDAVSRNLQDRPVRRLFVALGGAPSAGLLNRVLEGIGACGLPLEVHVVGAPSEATPSSAHGATMIMHQNTPFIHSVMAECDLAIGGGGGSAWERCCLGLPSLVIQVADNQRDVAANLAVAGAGIDLGPADTLTTATIADAVSTLAGDPARRQAMAHSAALACDGLGVRRVAAQLAPRCTPDGVPLTLRPAVDGDARLLFDWQQMPEVRRFANDPRPPAWETHLAWLARRLGNPVAGPFSIIMHGERPVGVVRLDAPVPKRFELPTGVSREESYLVSILVNPACHGRQIASTALAAVRDLMPDAVIYAEVLEENVASHRLFERSGYQRIRPTLYQSRPPEGLPGVTITR